MIDKTIGSLEQAVADVHDGATVMIGGFGNAGMPSALIDALIAQGARELTIVNNNAGHAELGVVWVGVDHHRAFDDEVLVEAHPSSMTRVGGATFPCTDGRLC